MNLRGKYSAKTPRGSGFTLIEVVISSALMALIVVSAYLCLNAGLASQKLIEPRVEIFQNARVAMSMMTADLRSVCAFPKEKDFVFLGTPRTIGDAQADNLDFATHNYTPRREREGDFCEISFYLSSDPETGKLTLWRRRNPRIAPDPLIGGSREEIATGLVGAKFDYYDGLDWYDTWGDIKGTKAQASNKSQPNLSGMPEAVRITLLFDANPRAKKKDPSSGETNEPPFVMTTVVRLNLAKADQKASSGATSSDSGGNAQNANGASPDGGPSQ
jgi:type II secretion system protein J